MALAREMERFFGATSEGQAWRKKGRTRGAGNQIGGWQGDGCLAVCLELLGRFFPRVGLFVL